MKDGSGATALITAAERGFLNCVVHLLRMGADIDHSQPPVSMIQADKIVTPSVTVMRRYQERKKKTTAQLCTMQLNKLTQK